MAGITSRSHSTDFQGQLEATVKSATQSLQTAVLMCINELLESCLLHADQPQCNSLSVLRSRVSFVWVVGDNITAKLGRQRNLFAQGSTLGQR